jgi:hypothetical protein
MLFDTGFQAFPWDYDLHLFKKTLSACFSLLGGIFGIEEADLIHGFTHCGKTVLSLKSGVSLKDP